MRATQTGIALAAAALLLASGCVSTPDATVAGVDSLSADSLPAHAVFVADPAPLEARSSSRIDADLESEVYSLANRLREAAGAPVLVSRDDLKEVARGHAMDMAARTYFSHTSPEGHGPGERARHIRFRALGENLARIRHSNDPAPLAIRGWLDSPPHRRVLLDERGVNYRFTGIGAAVAPDGTIYVAQVFLK
ncbi:MAG: CAP domain-containing protein [Planctomycetota bacterium]